MEMTNEAAMSLLAAVVEQTIVDARRLRNSGHLTDQIEVTDKTRHGVNRNFRKHQHKSSVAQHAFELASIVRTEGFESLVDGLGINLEPIEMMKIAISQKKVSRRQACRYS